METRTLLSLALPAVVLGGSFCTSANAAETLAVEDFNAKTNADSWFVYRYVTDDFEFPDWKEIDGGEENPAISATYDAVNGVSFLAIASSSNGVFSGDFVQAGAEGLASDIYLEDASLIRDVEFFLYDGATFYFSDPFSFSNNGWNDLEYSFRNELWYVLEGGVFKEAPITDEILSNIEQIGVNFFPFEALETPSRVGIDSFALLPDLTPPNIEVSHSSGEITLSFDQTANFFYTVQKSDTLRTVDWENLSEDTTDITGVGPYSATFDAIGKEFLRILSEPSFISVPDVEEAKRANPDSSKKTFAKPVPLPYSRPDENRGRILRRS